MMQPNISLRSPLGSHPRRKPRILYACLASTRTIAPAGYTNDNCRQRKKSFPTNVNNKGGGVDRRNHPSACSSLSEAFIIPRTRLYLSSIAFRLVAGEPGGGDSIAFNDRGDSPSAPPFLTGPPS